LHVNFSLRIVIGCI